MITHHKEHSAGKKTISKTGKLIALVALPLSRLAVGDEVCIDRVHVECLTDFNLRLYVYM